VAIKEVIVIILIAHFITLLPSSKVTRDLKFFSLGFHCSGTSKFPGSQWPVFALFRNPLLFPGNQKALGLLHRNSGGIFGRKKGFTLKLFSKGLRKRAFWTNWENSLNLTGKENNPGLLGNLGGNLISLNYEGNHFF